MKRKNPRTLEFGKTTFETIFLTVLLLLPLIFGVIVPLATADTYETITGVPAYSWRHGCVPTAVGMVVGYWDTHGYPDLIPGDASTQTEDVNQSIASQRDAANPGHYEDYCLPLDDIPVIKPDKSEDPPGDEHPDDCIADFLKTSRSVEGLDYGSTWPGDIGPGFEDYVNYRNTDYDPYFEEYSGTEAKEHYTLISQIDNDRPMVFIIDTDGTGLLGAVTVIGYKEETTVWYYGFIDPDDPTEIKWYPTYLASGNPGHVLAGWSFGLKPENPIENLPHDPGKIGAFSVSFDAVNQELLATLRIKLNGLDLSGSYQVNGKTVTGLDIRNQWEQGIEGIWSGWFDIIDFDYTYTIRTEVDWIDPGSTSGFDVSVQVITGLGRSSTTKWYTDAEKTTSEGAVAAHEVGHYFGLYDEYPEEDGGVQDPQNPITDLGSIMGHCGVPRLRHYEMFLKWLTTGSGRTNMVLASAPLPPDPNEPIDDFSEPSGIAPLAKPGGPYVAEEGYPIDFDGTGSSDLDGTVVSYQWDFGDGSPTSGSPTPTHTYEDSGVFLLTLTVTDDDGLIGMAGTPVTVLDTIPPSVSMISPPSGSALQDGATFIASATDDGSGVETVTFSIREDNGAAGVPGGFEDLPGVYNSATGNWELAFDTLQLLDGYYIVLVEATDNAGNVGSITVPYSIRNWAIIELLPSTPNNKAGRTMPIKFSLRVAAAVDPAMPFVYNDDLTIKIFVTSNPGSILQTSVFGNGASYYRIDEVAELYITNFKTSKVPGMYTVEIWRNGNGFLVGSFTFETVK